MSTGGTNTESLPYFDFRDEQEKEFQTNYLTPSLALLAEVLEQHPRKALVFRQLCNLVTSDCTPVRRMISIVEGERTQDRALLEGVLEILPSANDDDIIDIYNILFRLLHEYRLNKATKTPVVIFGQMITSGSTLAGRIQENVGRISTALNQGKPCNVTLLTSAQIEETALRLLSTLVAQKTESLMGNTSANASTSTQVSSTTSSTTVSTSPSVQTRSATKRKIEDVAISTPTPAQRVVSLLAKMENVRDAEEAREEEAEVPPPVLFSFQFAVPGLGGHEVADTVARLQQQLLSQIMPLLMQPGGATLEQMNAAIDQILADPQPTTTVTTEESENDDDNESESENAETAKRRKTKP